MAGRQAFLIQSSGKTAEHVAAIFRDRTYADEVIKHGYYRNDSWDAKKRDQDFGKVSVGDYIIQYCTNDVESYSGQIRNIYEVISLEKIDYDVDRALREGTIDKKTADQLRKQFHIIRLRIHTTLKKGLELSLIRKWVDDNTFSSGMNNCGRLGFNICEVEWNDYQTIVEWDQQISKRPLRCLILAPAGVNLNAIESLLLKRGMEPVIPSRIPFSGESIVRRIKDSILKADIVLAILDPRRSNSNIYFELGYALGMGKRTLILAPPEFELPIDIMDMFYIRASPYNLKAINFALDQALVVTKIRKPKTVHIQSQSHPISDATANALLKRIDELEATAQENQIAEIVLSALKAADISVVFSSKAEAGADFAVWVDELTPFTGNPILIEVKSRLGSHKDSLEIAYRVSRYLQASNSGWALVLYLYGPALALDAPTRLASRIIFLNVRDLIEGLRKKSFAQILRSLRNRQVHGIDS